MVQNSFYICSWRVQNEHPLCTNDARIVIELDSAVSELATLRAEEEEEARKAEEAEKQRRRGEDTEALRSSLRDVEESGGSIHSKKQSSLEGFWTTKKKEQFC